MSLAANNLLPRLAGERTRVLVLQDQMHSHVLPWQDMCERGGGSLLIVPRPADFDWTRGVLAALATGTVAVAALPPCHWCDGAVLDLEAIGAACAALGVPLVVDATQWVGSGAPLDVRRVGAAFVACSVHKWLLGPYGAALCYAAPSFWTSARPLEHHDRNREGAQHVECLPMHAVPTLPRSRLHLTCISLTSRLRLACTSPAPRLHLACTSLASRLRLACVGSQLACTSSRPRLDLQTRGYPLNFQPGARRLDAGGRPSYILMPMLRTSLELLRSATPAAIAAAVGPYTRELAARAKEMGFGVPPRHAPCIVGLWPAAHMPSAEALVAALARRTPPVVVGARFGAIRVSPHVYNTRADLEALLSGLKDALAPAETASNTKAGGGGAAAGGPSFGDPPEISSEEQLRRLWFPSSKL
eukprot:Transcript_19111.p1 GENE.Transcript_19111~~Transcript_19111.p1  ORF type:complete len:436 (+),score=157.12 Transcript_19111:61-1308(+)